MIPNKMCLLLILSFFITTVFSQIKIKYEQTGATLYANKKLEFVFAITGNAGLYTIKYKGIPNKWELNGNNLVLPNITKESVEDWTFDINITDAKRNILVQTVKLSVKNLKIQLSPVTLAQAQTADVSRDPSKNRQPYFFNLTDLINRYPGIQQKYYGPTYVASSVITPLIIANQQAKYIPERDARQISLLQRQRNAAAIRQNNAVKAIANLLYIINKIKSNINDAMNNLNVQINKLSYMKDLAFNCSEDQFKIENTIAKIKNAIEDRNTKISQEKKQIDAATKNMDLLRINSTALTNQKYDIERKIAPEGFLIIEAEKRVAQCDKNIKSRNSEIQAIRDTIRNNNLQIGVANDSIVDSNKRLKTINSSLDIVRQTIVDLKKQLAQAQQQQLDLMSNQSYYLSFPLQTKIKIDSFLRKNSELQNKSEQLLQKNRQQQQKCSITKSDIQKKKGIISQKQKSYSDILNRIDEIKKNIQIVEGQIKQRMNNNQNMSIQITALNNQLSKYLLQLTQQKYICSVIQQNKTKNQIRIDGLNNVITQNSNALAQTTLNLQKARAEKQLADLNMDQIMRRVTNVSPFSITPNGGSTILGGTPLGNNPSGSVFGPSFRVDSIERGTLQVGNLSTFLSTVYEMNLDPTDLLQAMSEAQKKNPNSNSTTLYPMDNITRAQLLGNNGPARLNGFTCQYSSNIHARSGLLQQILSGSGALNVLDYLNQRFTLSISACTRIASTVPIKSLQKGTRIYFTGAQIFTNLYNAYSILAIPQ